MRTITQLIVTALIVAALIAVCNPAPAQEPKPNAPNDWTKTLTDRAQRGKLHDRFQTVRGDSGKWQDDTVLIHAPPIEQKPARVSLDDWADQSRAKNPQLTGNADNWLLFRTRQLDDNDRVWVERIERRGNQFTLVIHEAIWQGRYPKNFTYYDVLGVNLGKLQPGKYEAKCLIMPLTFKQLEGPVQPRENWPKDELPAEKKPHELRINWTVSKAAAEPQAGNFASESLQVVGATREYRLVVPQSVDLSQPAPLVVAFHGMLIDSKDLMPRYTQLNETAEQHQFIVAYPNAIGRSWGLAPEKVQNDLAFFDALLAKLSAAYRIDPDRVYVLGMSNGGYFAHLVGKERSKVVAAVASHSGPLGLQTLLGVNAQRKFPVLIVHGDQDRILSVDFARENRVKYTKEGHEVKYVELAGHGHMWGNKVDINETIWEFFANRPREMK